MRHDPAAGAIVIMLRSLKMYGMAQAVTDLIEQGAPAFEAAASQLEPHIRLGKLDTEAEQPIAGRFGIRSIPTLIMLHKGREIARQSGAVSVNAIVAWAQRASGL